jgi:hypothetical protein
MKEALKLALEALEMYCEHGAILKPIQTRNTIKAALAQPAQEPVAWSSYEYDGIHHKPVAWMDRDGNFSDNNDHKCFPIPLYTITHPPRPWVGLTDDEVNQAIDRVDQNSLDWIKELHKFARAIEANLKETTE